MKTKTLTTFVGFMFYTFSVFAQVPEGFNYQAIARTSAGAIVANTPITVQISILLDGSAVVYAETHTETTNDYGLFTLVVGQGNPVSGSFSNIGWAAGSYSMKVEADFGGGLLDMGTSQLLTVPFAMNARNGVPPGSIVPFAGAIVPDGWLLCDGSAVSRTDYADLFTAAATAWGSGDGSTTFNLPDLRGMFLRGVDGNAGRDTDKNDRTASSAGGNSGNAVGSQQYWGTARPTTASSSSPGSVFSTDNPGNHDHPIQLANNQGNLNSTQVRVTSTGIGTGAEMGLMRCADCNATNFSPLDVQPGGAHTHTINGGGNSETRPVNVYVNYIIKY